MNDQFMTYSAEVVPYKILLSNIECNNIYPYLRSNIETGNKMYLVSPDHGRSYIVGNDNSRFVISKGNGLSYTSHAFLNTMEFGNDSWGLLLKQDAIRDFIIGNEVRKLGIKTNIMECVLELEKQITLYNGTALNPVVLQYSVECPYRISDSAYMTKDQIRYWVDKWDTKSSNKYKSHYQTATEVLIYNLHTLQKNGILHNAITPQNYTWALELLDFEIAHSPNYPYTTEDEQRHVMDLFAREIIYTYQIIVSIAWLLGEHVDYEWVDNMFEDYGFDLKNYVIAL